jgi:hypothetical protein
MRGCRARFAREARCTDVRVRRTPTLEVGVRQRLRYFPSRSESPGVARSTASLTRSHESRAA